MRFENSFYVDAPLEQVRETMLDVERVAPTVPGAQVLERTGDDAYKVAIKVKVGPMSMTYRGEVEITERYDAAHRAVMKARAKESRGQGTADADVTMALSGANGGTTATVTTDVQLSGKVATMGQGVLQDVSGRRVQTFAQNLAAMLEGRETAAGGEAATPGGEAAARPGGATAAEPRGRGRDRGAGRAARRRTPSRGPPPRPRRPPTRSTSARWAARWSPSACATRARWPRCWRSPRSSVTCSAVAADPRMDADQILAFRLARSGLAVRGARDPAAAAACPASDFARDAALLALAARADGVTGTPTTLRSTTASSSSRT